MLCLELLRTPSPRRLRGIEPLDAVAAATRPTRGKARGRSIPYPSHCRRRRGTAADDQGTWKTGDQKSLAVEWAPVGAKKCLVARVEILMGADGAPKMTSFLVEDLDEVLELSD